jgi:hypothetical protein
MPRRVSIMEASPMTENAAAPPPLLFKRSGSQKRQRHHSLQIALSNDELAKVEEQAQACGLSRSSYGRAAILGTPGPRARRSPPIDAKAMGRATAALNKIGSNVNQIAHVLNAGGSLGMAREYLSTLAVIREAAKAIREAAGRKDRV